MGDILVSIYDFIAVYITDGFREKRIAIRIPTSLQIIILLFIFASMYLGEIHRYFIVLTGGTGCCIRLPR